MKSGQISKAWSLLSTAARMCVDLGFHRPTPGTAELDQFQSRKVFWYIFVMEKGVALTLGRPPNLRIADVAVDTLDYPNEILGIPGKIAISFFELATIEEEMASQLFSSSSQQVTTETRRSAAHGFRQRLQDVQKRMQMVCGIYVVLKIESIDQISSSGRLLRGLAVPGGLGPHRIPPPLCCSSGMSRVYRSNNIDSEP